MFVFLAGALFGSLPRWNKNPRAASRRKNCSRKTSEAAPLCAKPVWLPRRALKLRENGEILYHTAARTAIRNSAWPKQKSDQLPVEGWLAGNDLRSRHETLKKGAALEAEREELNWLLKLRKEQLQKLIV